MDDRPTDHDPLFRLPIPPSSSSSSSSEGEDERNKTAASPSARKQQPLPPSSPSSSSSSSSFSSQQQWSNPMLATPNAPTKAVGTMAAASTPTSSSSSFLNGSRGCEEEEEEGMERDKRARRRGEKIEAYKQRVLASIAAHITALGAQIREDTVLSLLDHPPAHRPFLLLPSSCPYDEAVSASPTSLALCEEGRGQAPPSSLCEGGGARGGRKRLRAVSPFCSQGDEGERGGRQQRRQQEEQEQEQEEEQGCDDACPSLFGEDGDGKRGQEASVAAAAVAKAAAGVAKAEAEGLKEEVEELQDMVGRLAWERSRLQSSLNACIRLLLDAADSGYDDSDDNDSSCSEGDDEMEEEGARGRCRRPLQGVLPIRRFGDVTEEEVKAALMAHQQQQQQQHPPAPSPRTVAAVRNALDSLVRDASLDIHEGFRSQGRVLGVNYSLVQRRMASVGCLRPWVVVSKRQGRCCVVVVKEEGNSGEWQACGGGGGGQREGGEKEGKGEKGGMLPLVRLLVAKKGEVEGECPSGSYPTERLWDWTQNTELPLPQALERVILRLQRLEREKRRAQQRKRRRQRQKKKQAKRPSSTPAPPVIKQEMDDASEESETFLPPSALSQRSQRQKRAAAAMAQAAIAAGTRGLEGQKAAYMSFEAAVAAGEV